MQSRQQQRDAERIVKQQQKDQREALRQQKKDQREALRLSKQIEKLTKQVTKTALREGKADTKIAAKLIRELKREEAKLFGDMATMFERAETNARKVRKVIQPVPVPEESKVETSVAKKRVPRTNNRGLGKKTVARKEMRQQQEEIFRTNPAGIQIRTFQIDQDQQLGNADELLSQLENLENNRTIVSVTFRVIMIEEKDYRTEKDKKEMGLIMTNPRFPNNIQPMILRPREAKEYLSRYGHIIIWGPLFISYETKHVPEQGACDTAEHIVTHSFQGDDGELITIKTASIKSKDNNCLIVAMGSVSNDKSRAHKIRSELKIPDGAISVEFCDRIADRLNVTYALYRIIENRVEVISESESISPKHINLLLLDDHYWKILSDMLPFRSRSYEASMQIQDRSDTAPQACDTVVTTGEHDIEDRDLESVSFKDTFVDPSVEQVLELVDDKTPLLIIGAGGCGKTWLLKKMMDVVYTATTACAAELFPGGKTIHSHMVACRKQKTSKHTVVVDEVSMMGSVLFEEVFEWATKGKHHLVLSGDFLQLPPVNDRFFFQSSSFYEFAKEAVMIKLTVVKRQENVDQATFLNNLRVGVIDRKMLSSLTRNVVRDPELVLASKKDFVQEYNKKKLEELGSEIVNYETTITKKSDVRTQKNQLAIGCKAIITKNFTPFFNGQRVTVIETNQKTVMILTEKGQKHIINYTEDIDGDRKEYYIPVEACYALTIHKSQGQTVKSCVVHVDGLFEQGMAYVALSRCTDLNRVQIRDKIDINDKGWQPNPIALEFYNTGRTCPADQLLFISNTKKQLKNIIRKEWEPLEKKFNAIFIDFETYLDGHIQRPYYNKILHQCSGKTVHEQSFFDQLWNGGERCDVGQSTWDYIRNVAVAYADNLVELKKNKDKIGIVRGQRKLCPTIVGYNLSGFDLHFLMQKYLGDSIASCRFKLNTIYKGTSLIFFQVFDRLSQEIVLKTHDMFQITSCSLDAALKNFCGSEGKALAEKISFKDEIMHLLSHYKTNPDILRPGVETEITRRVFTDADVKHESLGKRVRLYDEVIRYADNDVDVLPILYRCVDGLTKEALGGNCTDFLTAGSMAWYGAVTHLPDDAYEQKKRNKHGKEIQKRLNTKLYRLEQSQEEFVRASIKGGRVAPRIHHIKNSELVYLDISGMYASIMDQEILPFGKAMWVDDDQVKVLMNTVKRYGRRDQWRTIYKELTAAFGLFVAEIDFQENQSNLEPVVQFKKQGKTVWTVERRTDVVTSIDIALILASGGKVFDIKRVMRWEHNGAIMSKWISKTLAIKKQGELTGNGAKKSFGKLLANAAYGQTLKRDRNEVTSIVSCWQQANEFVSKNRLSQLFECGQFTVMRGEKIVHQDQFVTSRCSFIGAFVLGYTRGMVYDIVEVACPNRYNEQGVREQPIYGDTDSLVFQRWQADLLIRDGWIAKASGKLTDELTDDKDHWFIPSRLMDSLPRGSVAQQQDYLWNEATEAEKRDPNNFRFSFATDFIASAPKSYACRYIRNGEICEKIKFKGIPQTALVDGKRLDFEGVGISYQNPGKSKAVLQGGIQILKVFTKIEGTKMFSQIVDSNLRRNKPVTRTLFKTSWQGRMHLAINKNLTVPWGWRHSSI